MKRSRLSALACGGLCTMAALSHSGAFVANGLAHPRQRAPVPPPVVIDGTVKCVFLRIAPYQPFSPPLPSVNDVVLHDPDGYRNAAGVLQLEDVMRLGAANHGCPTSRGSGKARETFRYSLTLAFKRVTAPAFTPFVSDVVSSTSPVPLPSAARPSEGSVVIGSLRATGRLRSCDLQHRCETPITLWTQAYTVNVYGQGSLASVKYDRTILSLEDWDRARGAVVRVRTIKLAPAIASRSVTFTAVGRSTTSSNAFRDVTLSPSQPQSVPFGIYQDDFYDPDVLLSKDQNGTDKRSGLRWPKVFGSNRGRPFWYSATLPDVVRDLVQHCFPEPDAYYRLPWTNAESHGVGQGNNTPLNLTDPDPSHRPGSSQAFAFDFTMPAGTLLRAARGGRVEWVRETHPDAIYDETQPENPTTNHPWGNALRIRHQDGSTSWYFHLRMNRVRVQKGDVVQRGQPIARSGNSGRSTGPHLHFQVQANSKDWGQTIRIRFGGTSFSPTKSGCLSPGKGAVLVSDNANPKFP